MFHFLCSLLWEFEKGKPRLGPTLAGLSVLLVALTHADRSPGVPCARAHAPHALGFPRQLNKDHPHQLVTFSTANARRLCRHLERETGRKGSNSYELNQCNLKYVGFRWQVK